jgi:hypothetical protein
MAGRGMGIATKGGGAVSSGPKNKVLSMAEQTTGPVMMAKGGEAINQHKKMAMGMAGGGMMNKGYAAGGMMKKGYAAGGAVMKKKMMAMGGKRGK